jgi:hypothetical protein
MKKRDIWVFSVLTVFRSFKGHEHAYRYICDSLKKLRKRMERKYGEVTYLRIVEQHKDKYPHVNFVFHCDAIFEEFSDAKSLNTWTKRWFTENARECGFGVNHKASYVKSSAAVSKYMAKAAINSELSKTSQIPLYAPSHFRRLGATRGLLPPRKGEKTGWKGELIKSPLSNLTSSGDVRIITNTR